MNVFPIYLLLLLCLLSCRENIEFSKPCAPKGSSSRHIYPEDSLTFGFDINSEELSWVEVCQPPRHGRIEYVDLLKVRYFPEVVAGNDSFILRKMPISQEDTFPSDVKHFVHIYENEASRCISVFNNNSDTLIKHIKRSQSTLSSSYTHQIEPTASHCDDLISSFTITKEPEFGSAVVNERFQVLWFTEPDSNIVVPSNRDIMEFEMCIDTGTELLCRDFVLVVNYRS